MNLILWRHAHAQDGHPDLERPLTELGHRQAARMADWLRERLPPVFILAVSPAARARATAAALQSMTGAVACLEPRLAPGCKVSDLLDVVQWPLGPGHGERTVVVVGHQPSLGMTAAHLLAEQSAAWRVRRGGLWWLSQREHHGMVEVVVQAVIGPELA